MGQHILFLVLTPLLVAPAAHGFRANAVGQDLELQVKGKTGQVTEERCGIVVAEVQKSKSYTEESIRPICDREIKSSRCDFLAEALSLASSHSEFDGKEFCEAIVSAQFCAQTMDHLLTSQAMADLARGDCNRAPNTKGSAYCEKFQKMLSYSVQNNDLDTMRACYEIEAYSELGTASNSTNHTEGSANKTTLQPTHDSPQNRIISTSSKDLDPVSGDEHTPAVATAARPASANTTDEESSASEAAASPSEAPEGESIVVEPKKEGEEVEPKKEGEEEPKKDGIVTDPTPTNSQGGSSISTDPIYIKEKNAEVPATQEEAEQLKPIGSEVNTPPAEAKGEQPAATVPAATVNVDTSHQMHEVRLNIGGPANLLSTKTKASVVSKLLKRKALLNGGSNNASVEMSVPNASAATENTNSTNS